MGSQPQNPEYRINTKKLHHWKCNGKLIISCVLIEWVKYFLEIRQLIRNEVYLALFH